MCCVMPPASPLTTLVLRMASSSEVLPWSTWPMMVTTGGRDSRCSSVSIWPMKPSSTSASDTRLGVWPNSVTISSAVSASITSLILCISPCVISSLMTSTDRSVMRLASSWIVITSGMITSRMTLSRGCCTPARRNFSRSRLRRSEASERSRCASSNALLIVSLMRSRRSSAALTGLLTGLAPFFLPRASSSTSGSSSAARPVRRATCSAGRRSASAVLPFSGVRASASAAGLAGASALTTSGFVMTVSGASRAWARPWRTQCLETSALALGRLGTLLLGLERATACIEFVGRRGRRSSAEPRSRQVRGRLRLPPSPAPCRPRLHRASRACASSSSRPPPTSSGRG